MFEYWRTKDGEFIQVIDMETSHIENCIKAIENGKITLSITGDEECSWLRIFRNELKFRKYYERIENENEEVRNGNVYQD